MHGEIFLSFQSGHKEMQHFFQINFSSKSSIVFSFPSLFTHRQAADSTTQLGPHYTPSTGQEGYRSIRDVLPHTATQ